MQHLIQQIMSSADILKIIMLVGIAMAIPFGLWLGKMNKELAEENRLARLKIDRDRKYPDRSGNHRAAGA